MLLLYAIAFVISVVALALSSVFLLNSITKIAIKMRISEFLIGFVLVAVGSSLPELLVGIVAATEGEPLLSLGNIIGSNIANLTIILGIPALIAGGIRIRSQVRNREIIYMNIFAVAPLILLLDGVLSRGEGILLLLLFAFYLYNLVLRSNVYTKVMKDHKRKISLPKQILFVIVGLTALLLSAEVLIRSGITIATALGIPTILIGIFALALGTSLPELSFNITAAVKRQGEILMGNTLGSIVSNATLVLGITALIRPIVIDGTAILITSSIVLLFSLLIFTNFARSQYKVTVKEGLVLVLGYIAFIVFELFYSAGV
ncbi:MAG: calcium/sodium antiporter [Patescibacteria group bacterium]|nr:MAG: calcium/sodium antiporter [Patescibacteria group bacterium]